MPRRPAVTEIALRPPDGAPGVSRSAWLYGELRDAILSGRLRRGVKISASRDIAQQYGLARGTVVAAFEQLAAEGYLETRRGAGTFVSTRIPEDLQLAVGQVTAPSLKIEAAIAPGASGPPRAFRVNEPALDQFPIALWARLASRRHHRASRLLLAGGDPRGYLPLREAIAGYLGASRGVHCEAAQVVVVSGTQHALDLLARLIVNPGEAVWMEDPGYPGAVTAFERASARIVAVPVTERGFDLTEARRREPAAKAVYITPAHQFPLGMAMPLSGRLALLDWASASKGIIVEDDYDSEFRFGGRPLPALQGLDTAGSVVFLGSFNKVLFPSLRIGYAVLPPWLVEPFAALRFNVDRFSPQLDQAILCDFIGDGHFARHLRRMRALYETRLCCLREAVASELAGQLEIPSIEAGLQTAAVLPAAFDSRRLVQAAERRGLEAVGLHRYQIERRDISGLLLGFAAIPEREIRRGVRELAGILSGGIEGRGCFADQTRSRIIDNPV